jgi:hypothetical protein
MGFHLLMGFHSFAYLLMNNNSLMNMRMNPNIEGLANLPPGMRGEVMNRINNNSGFNQPINNIGQIPMINGMIDKNNITEDQLRDMPVDIEKFQQMSQINNYQNNGIPQLNHNQINNVVSQLPENYSGDIPLHLQSQLPMIGGAKKKKTYTIKNRGGYENEQIGGKNARIVPIYKDSRNTPFKPNQQKKIETKRYKETERKQEAQKKSYEKTVNPMFEGEINY